ncbi:MAG: GCN5-related N-acetyltransferase [Clostridia bacterium]|jgi:predicted acetyltransferase|nr:GCN5-related N-acetyltransferase [Clostridia bacterium]
MVINSQFKKLDAQDIVEFIRLGGLAYPFMNIHTPEDLQKQADRFIKMQNEDPDANIYGAYRDDKLIGGMQLQDFTMNFDGVQIKAGGVGFVAVDLLHKKERIAKDIISYFIDHYRQRKVVMAMLYPFRPDFYKQMGFGFGTKMNQYKVKPVNLPRVEHKENIQYLTEQDKAEVIDCYNRFAEKTHGMIKRTNIETANIFAPGKTTVIYRQGDKVEGYLSFFFKKVGELNPLKNDIVIKELIYHNLEAFKQLLNFLHTQFDQINRIVINTQVENFHYLLSDPRDDSDNEFAPIYHQSNLQGVGLMYRIIDTAEFFTQLAEHSFNNENIKLKLNIVDSFVDENNKPVIVEFKNGKPLVVGGINYDAEISMDISDFSAMAMGCVEFRALMNLGLAKISDKSYAETVNNLFRTKDKPICTTIF